MTKLNQFWNLDYSQSVEGFSQNVENPLEKLISEIYLPSHTPHQGTPQFSIFSKEVVPNKGKVPYNHYPRNILCQGIARLLKKAMADLVWYLGPQTTVVNIMGKYNLVYGMVA